MIKNIFYPLSLFEIYGNYCCVTMHATQQKDSFAQNFLCFHAQSMIDSNVVILWGSFSLKLINVVSKQLNKMPYPRVLIHIRGCEKRVDNKYSNTSLNQFLPINIIFSQCELGKMETKKILLEAKKCLKA